MKINGLTVGAAAIGNGIYGMIVEQGEEAIVAFGMIPKWAIDMLEAALKAKIIAEAARQVNCTPLEIELLVDDKMLADTMRPIVHAVTVEIYRAASNANAMLI